MRDSLGLGRDLFLDVLVGAGQTVVLGSVVDPRRMCVHLRMLSVMAKNVRLRRTQSCVMSYTSFTCSHWRRMRSIVKIHMIICSKPLVLNASITKLYVYLVT